MLYEVITAAQRQGGPGAPRLSYTRWCVADDGARGGAAADGLDGAAAAPVGAVGGVAA